MKIILTVLAAIFFLFLSKIFGFFVDIIVLSIAIIFTVKYRMQIANVFTKNPKPGHGIIVLSALPFIIFEELVNAPVAILPLTIPALLLSIFVLIFLAKKFQITRMLPIILIYSIIGIFFEVNVGESSAEFATLDIFTYWFIVFWVGLSYTFLTIIPLTLYLRNNYAVTYEK